MLKIVVFDGGWGGELVASFLQHELEMVSVTKVIDWLNVPYETKTAAEIYILAQKYLAPFIGKVDLIVLGGYTVSVALEQLRSQYPQQKFVGMGISYNYLLKLRQPPNQIALLCNSSLVETSLCTDLQDYLPESTLIIPDSSGWEELINTGEMTSAVLRTELQDYFALSAPSEAADSLASTTRLQSEMLTGKLRIQVLQFLAREQRLVPQTRSFLESGYQDYCSHEGHGSKANEASYSYADDKLAEDLLRPDTLLVLNTHFWEIEPELQEVFGMGARVLDFRSKLLHDVCLALDLRGVDGMLGYGQ